MFIRSNVKDGSPDTAAAIGTWNVTSLEEKDLELEIVGFVYSSPAQLPCNGVRLSEREGHLSAPLAR